MYYRVAGVQLSGKRLVCAAKAQASSAVFRPDALLRLSLNEKQRLAPSFFVSVAHFWQESAAGDGYAPRFRSGVKDPSP
jgi:hypothetical protein